MQTALIAAEVGTNEQDEAALHRERSAKLRRWRTRRAFRRLLRLPFLPEREVLFGSLFFNTLYFIAKRHGYQDKKREALHILTFRRFLMRFYHLVADIENHLDDEKEVSKRMLQFPTWIGWEHLHKALDPDVAEEVIDIKVPRNKFELVIAVLEANDSILGYVWSSIMTICILTSLAVIVMGAEWFPVETNAVCIVTFTVEYLVRLICAPFCRNSLVEMSRIYKDIVPESCEHISYMSGASTKTARLLTFLAAPMNLVDLISILPWWVSKVCSTSGLKLGFLRSLRLVRLIRLMKVGGLGRKFEIMCDVFASSMGAIMAITITLVVLSLMFGALMAQVEDEYIPADAGDIRWRLFPLKPPQLHDGQTLENYAGKDLVNLTTENWMDMVGEGGTNVPLTMLWVSGRLTNMQSNMADPVHSAIPANWFNQVVVHILGIMKGFVFLLPLGQIKKISKDEDQRWQEIDELEYQVECASKVKAGDEWTVNMTSHFATVEVFEMDEHEEVSPEDACSSARLGSGRLNMPHAHDQGPLAEVKSIAHCSLVSLVATDILDQTGGDTETMLEYRGCRPVSPVVFFEVAWAPAEGAAGGKGTLTLHPIEAQGFPALAAGKRWKLRIRVHETLFGAAAYKWTDIDPGEIQSRDASVQFSVDYSRPQDSLHAEAEKDGEDLGMLRERLAGQMATLGAIEEAGRKARK